MLPDPNTIALVSVVAGASTAIAVPLINALTQSKGDERRFANERASKDVEDLRVLLDETALALHDTDKAMRRFTGIIITEGPQDWEKRSLFGLRLRTSETR